MYVIFLFVGLLGPTLHGQEGDVIVVTFRNMVDQPCNIHTHGIAYGKQSEGEFQLMSIMSNNNFCKKKTEHKAQRDYGK